MVSFTDLIRVALDWGLLADQTSNAIVRPPLVQSQSLSKGKNKAIESTARTAQLLDDGVRKDPFLNNWYKLTEDYCMLKDSQTEKAMVDLLPEATLPKLEQTIPKRHDSTNTSNGRDWFLSTVASSLLPSAMHGVLDEEQLAISILTLLRSEADDASLEHSLVELLGYSCLDFLTELLVHRHEVVRSITANASLVASATVQAGARDSSTSKASHKFGPLVHINEIPQKVPRALPNFDSDQEQQKISERLLFPERFATKPDESSVSLLRVRFDLSNGTDGQSQKYPGVFAREESGALLDVFGHKFGLPSNTERLDSFDWEEFVLPPSETQTSFLDDALVRVEQLDDTLREAFKGYKTLNVIQSMVYPVAYASNENMLVSAPTGAGKTDVAMLTILNAFTNGTNGQKVVYVAPMKALAAEITRKFSKRLSFLKKSVRELTGDMPLTRVEVEETDMLVVTPEKWDVVTRKPSGNNLSVSLLILDEVHLLQDERGSVIESIVARTLRRVEQIQSMIRIVGLSATLPNYLDVADFLGVNRAKGLFVFDSRFRPVPLEQHIVGVKGKLPTSVEKQKFNLVTFDKIEPIVASGKQVMIFVHSRRETVDTAMALIELAQSSGSLNLFDCTNNPRYDLMKKNVEKARTAELFQLFESGFAVHHAGMQRSDRLLVERLFTEQLVKVLVCTSTLAWGVNLPAYAVVIKGTQVYDTGRGGFVDLSILDTLQIFGRAGRPQFEQKAVAYIITKQEKLQHYLRLMCSQQPIESQLTKRLPENLNAEIALGNVSTVDEAVSYLKYTFYYVRVRKSPLVYGFQWSDVGENSHGLLLRVATKVLEELEKAQCIQYDRSSGSVSSKDIGRISSHYYLTHRTVQTWNEVLASNMSNAEVLSLLSLASEFEMIRARPEETVELKKLTERSICKIRGTPDTFYGKSNCLLQAYISRLTTNSPALATDTLYIAQNSTRLLRALFEMALSRGLASLAQTVLHLCISVERQAWPFQTFLLQFSDVLPFHFVRQISQSSSAATLSVHDWRDMDDGELLHYVKQKKSVAKVKQVIASFPVVQVALSVQPISRTVGKIRCAISADFKWSPPYQESFWIFCEYGSTLLYHTNFTLSAKRPKCEQLFHLPLPTPNETGSLTYGTDSDIYVSIFSNSYNGCEVLAPLELQKLPLPSSLENESGFTNLENLNPLPVSAVCNERVERYFRETGFVFNPIQSRIFNVFYHMTNENVLLGAPTGGGKTMAAEIAMFATWRDCPEAKIVYIAPLKALVKERLEDWGNRLSRKHFLEFKCIELTGDSMATSEEINGASLYITTPEKWDAITRGWRRKDFVKKVRLVIMDEIHLLGSDRGPVLEMLVSRLQRMQVVEGLKVRVVGLSTALANAVELSTWLGVNPSIGLFNFRHAVRSVPLDVYISGFAGQHYCPRMNSMNKSVYQAIQRHSPTKPVLVFVSSRRQTRLTALDLIKYCSLSSNPRQFLGSKGSWDAEDCLAQVQDSALKTALPFGIGIHHAGLVESDRVLVESLFGSQLIQVLVATSTLAWGVNFPAHLVVVKGTEFYDAKYQHGYVDYPLTDVLQMMGRAGRPQFDTSAVACVFVHDVKKSFYKRFLHQSFPLESSLHKVLSDHLNAEIANGSVKSRQDAVEFLSWTFLFRRLQHNPGYYGLEAISSGGDGGEEGSLLDRYVSCLIEQCLSELSASLCISLDGQLGVSSTVFGSIASFYYLKHQTVHLFVSTLRRSWSKDDALCWAMALVSRASEFDELPVRHNEDSYNERLQQKLPASARRYFEKFSWDDPHVKTFLLLQSHLSRFRVDDYPTPDFFTDLKSVLDQVVRVAQAMIDVACELCNSESALSVMELVSAIKQAQWPSDEVRTRQNFSLTVRDVGRTDAGAVESAQVVERVLSVRLFPKRTNLVTTNVVDAPLFPKPLTISWWVLIRNSEGAILCFKRVFNAEHSSGCTYKARIKLSGAAQEKGPLECIAVLDGYLTHPLSTKDI